MDQPKYKRVLIKISGEALAGDKHFGLDFQVMGRVAEVIRECVDMGVQVGVVIGGGNFWRGVKDGEGHIERTRADHMGMLATAMNCMAMADVLEQKGVDVRVQTALEIRAVAEPYIHRGICEIQQTVLWCFQAAIIEEYALLILVVVDTAIGQKFTFRKQRICHAFDVILTEPGDIRPLTLGVLCMCALWLILSVHITEH